MSNGPVHARLAATTVAASRPRPSQAASVTASPLPSRCAAASWRHALWRRAVGTVIVVLHARDVRHAEVMPVPAIEAVDVEQPEPAAHVGQHDQAIVVANV